MAYNYHTVNNNREINMMSSIKDKRINARVTEIQYAKLRKHLDNKGLNFSEWVRNKIDLMKEIKG